MVIKIPKNITREHIINAIEEINAGREIPNKRAIGYGCIFKTNRYYYTLVYNNKEYPPKYIISLANVYANNEELLFKNFGGGDSGIANNFLKSLGFEINQYNCPP